MAARPEVPLPPWQTPPKRAHARAPITQDLIVETALRILDAENLDALSMRRVAQELGTGPASLYAHVASKKELLDLMFDRVVGEIPAPAPAEPERWQEQVREFAIAMHATMAAHSDLARVALGNIPTGPNAMRLSEVMLSILLGGGVPRQDVAWFVDRLMLYVSADAYEGSLWQSNKQFDAENPADMAAMVEAIRGYFGSLPVDQFPSTVSLAPELTSGEYGERFEFGLDLLLDGLAARARRAGG